jgi:hypothetical protein
MRALQRAAAIGILSLVVAGCGSQQVAAPLTNTVTAVKTSVREVVTTSVSTAPPVTVSETVLETETATETATETETATVTVTETPEPVVTEASTAAATTTPAASPVKPQKYTGSGDDVVTIDTVDSAAILKFQCPNCSGNVVLKTDGSEGLLVNTIGSYTGTHVINVGDGSVTGKLTISAEGDWTVSIGDLSTASKALSGVGDTALQLSGSTTDALIKNNGDGNFVVQVYNSDGADLAVNEIGIYSGTVPMVLPALVQVTSQGSWSISPK